MEWLTLVAAKDVAEEGRDIVLSMLVVGCVFLGVILVGQLLRWLNDRR